MKKNNRNEYMKQVGKISAFLLLAIIGMNFISKPLVNPDNEAFSRTHGIYEEEPNSLDAVFIGSSNTYAFWNPLFAWKEYGIASCSYTANSAKLSAFQYMIEEARKTQPNAIYVVSMSNPDLEVSYGFIHDITDYMHFSKTKLELIKSACHYNDYTLDEVISFYFPLYLYHGRWDQIQKSDFFRKTDGLKGSSTYPNYLNKRGNISAEVVLYNERAELSEKQLEALDRLLDYCAENRVRVLFLNPPQFRYSEIQCKQINTVLDRIEERGFPVLRMKSLNEKIGLDYTTDYYNSNHTNIHGSLKYTRFISQYLLNSYGLEDKRGEPGYSSFDLAWDRYEEIIAPYIEISP